MAKSYLLFGRRVFEEAIKNRVSINEIYYENDSTKKFILEYSKELLFRLQKGLPREVKEESHQGVAFRVNHEFYLEMIALNKNTYPFVLLCNHIEDVQNFGTLIRSAAAFGVKLIVHEERRSVSLTPAAIKTSAGLAFRMKFLEVGNLLPFVKQLQEAHYFVFGLSAEKEAQNLYENSLPMPLGLIVGSEHEGLSRPLIAACDQLIKIPMTKEVESLNAAQAASIALSWIYHHSLKNKSTQIKHLDRPCYKKGN